jgi:hypothetical protein
MDYGTFTDGFPYPIEDESDGDTIYNPEGFNHARPEPLTQDEVNSYRNAEARRDAEDAYADELNDRMRDEGF